MIGKTLANRAALMGALMGAMMIFMIHNGAGDFALGFIFAHVVVVAIGAGLALWAVKRGKPRLLRWVHRPSRGDMISMGAGMGTTALAVCALCLTGQMGMM